jgi:predicted Zn-dependent peptidase
LFIVVIPKPGNEVATIRKTIMNELHRLATDGPGAEEMEKLHNNLLNDSVRNRQSSLFRAQQLAEFALYDGQPELFNTELNNYLKVSASEIQEAVARYLDTDNRVLLDIVPTAEEVAPATALPPGEPTQPGAPPPLVPELEPAEPEPPASPAPTPIAYVQPQSDQSVNDGS